LYFLPEPQKHSSLRPIFAPALRGAGVLAAAEDLVRERDGRRIRMTVLSARKTLIAWYERRGYALTGETEPVPLGDEKFLGTPLRDGLYFVVMGKDL